VVVIRKGFKKGARCTEMKQRYDLKYLNNFKVRGGLSVYKGLLFWK